MWLSRPPSTKPSVSRATRPFPAPSSSSAGRFIWWERSRSFCHADSDRSLVPQGRRCRCRPEPLALHPAPGAAASQEVPEGFHLEHGEDLAVAEVLEDAVEYEPGEVFPAGVAAKGDFLEKHRGDGEKYTEEDGQDQKENEEVEVQDAEPVRQRDHDVAENLDEGAEGLEDEEVGQPEHADDAVLGGEDHVFVTPQALEQAAVPAVALAGQDAEGGRDFGPAHGVGDEDDAVLAAGLAHVLVELQDELEVLGFGPAVVASGRDHLRLAVQAERAGDDEQRPQAAPSDAPSQERPQVFDDLEDR